MEQTGGWQISKEKHGKTERSIKSLKKATRSLVHQRSFLIFNLLNKRSIIIFVLIMWILDFINIPLPNLEKIISYQHKYMFSFITKHPQMEVMKKAARWFQNIKIKRLTSTFQNIIQITLRKLASHITFALWIDILNKVSFGAPGGSVS